MDFDIFIDDVLFKVYAIKCRIKDFFGKRLFKNWASCMYRDTLKRALRSIEWEKANRQKQQTEGAKNTEQQVQPDNAEKEIPFGYYPNNEFE